ncbi:UDP-N-acetylenolpyruvoylglucosamine reductase [Nocardioides psychrotolerans]|uniref:UDP-N-acetylenolpyruvoylglucosamine reductase n=1 Tax=Nocardioides psychrotolerans TaxID=1005945 RepID=A0A1I3HZD7_9ACTN|nr:UDP-N-acetylmuramate dehydrogenase [Nocardioides psychrotolerans]GEP38668.1 UDP-N-acetylenolpyruvoylglucosamine reductase [Nocardioides psychrotolerans]SFI41061.1 UDP-N-acetylmuramate dehydrogenase [Nocardioides psychrotolerans]
MPDQTLLADHTTLHLGGPARRFVVARTEAELVAAVRRADEVGEPLLVLGGGSNLVVGDAGFDGTVVQVATTGVLPDVEGDDASCGGVLVTVAAGESWDALVATAVERGWVGIEALSGIPGSVGATPIQNVGAYGQEVSQTVASVRVWDRTLHGVRTFANADCDFAYRHSRFKADPGRQVVLSVTFQLAQGTLGAPVGYAELARTLGVEPGQRAPLAACREAVLGLRRGKGMVLDEADHDTWSAGSFFTNPVVAPEVVPEGAPAWPVDGGVKTSAAWLIEHAGFGKGYGSGAVAVSGKHTLALTNRGGATTEDLLGLAREVRDGVEARFGIRLVNEPVLLGCVL